MIYIIIENVGGNFVGKRTYENDIISMALLYRKKYVGTDMISYDKAIKFDSVINYNLDNMDATCGIGIRTEETSRLWFIMHDENGNKYAVINPTTDLKKAWEFYIDCLPVEVCVASEMDNALKEIGLIVVDGMIVDRNLYYNELRKKYKFRNEFQPQRFDIFRAWENLPENGFVENYCISREEKNILYELRRNREQNQLDENRQLNVLRRVKQ